MGDCTASTLVYIALNFIPASVYQMLRGGSIATTFLFSIIIIRAKILRHQVVGSVLALLGITIVGLSNILISEESDSNVSVVCIFLTYS